MTARVLIVDDDAPVRRALQRLLHAEGYELFEAADGAQAVVLLTEQDIAVLLCDQRMPGLQGAAVLAEAARLRPDAYRIALTGDPDLSTALASINEGGVHYFVRKPWDDVHLRQVIRTGVARHEIVRENRRLTELTQQQNAKLEAWGCDLEQTVAQRTAELRAQNATLQRLQQQLENSLRDTVGVLVGVLEAYNPSLGIHAKRVAALTRSLALRLDLSPEQLRDIEFASLLHDIGKISRIHTGDANTLGRRCRQALRLSLRHSDCGAAILAHVRGFENVAQTVRHQNEHYDGSGHPDGLRRDDIPIGARLIALAEAYDEAVFSTNHPTRVWHSHGRHEVTKGLGTLFDPHLVTLLFEHLDAVDPATTDDTEVELAAAHIHKGMVLSRDILNAEGVRLLSRGTHLTVEHVERIRSLARANPLVARIFVRCSAEEGDADGACDAAEAPATHLAPPARPERPRILVVDDDAHVCAALTRELRAAGWDVTSARDGRVAQNMLEDQTFDALLIDVAMPVMNGVLLVAHVRQCWPDVPCIILTGHATREQLLRLTHSANVVEILAKPWDAQRLRAALDKARQPHRAPAAAEND